MIGRALCFWLGGIGVFITWALDALFMGGSNGTGISISGKAGKKPRTHN